MFLESKDLLKLMDILSVILLYTFSVYEDTVLHSYPHLKKKKTCLILAKQFDTLGESALLIKQLYTQKNLQYVIQNGNVCIL